MKYTSPFRLLPKRKPYPFIAADVQQWKEELLSEFETEQSSSIVIHSKKYDKKSVLKAFGMLEAQPKYHLLVYENKPLLNFIEKRDIDFFSGLKNYASFQDPDFQNWIAPYFIPQYNEVVYQYISTKEMMSFHSLKRLHDSPFPFPEEWEIEAHKKAYDFLTDFIKKANATLNRDPIPVVRNKLLSKRLDIKPKASEYIDVHYAKMLDLLPEHFEKIRFDYGAFNHRVIKKIFDKRGETKRLTENASEVIVTAAEIDVMMRNDKASKKMLSELGINVFEGFSKPVFYNADVDFLGGWVNHIVFVVVFFFIILPIGGYLLLLLLDYII